MKLNHIPRGCVEFDLQVGIRGNHLDQLALSVFIHLSIPSHKFRQRSLSQTCRSNPGRPLIVFKVREFATLTSFH